MTNSCSRSSPRCGSSWPCTSSATSPRTSTRRPPLAFALRRDMGWVMASIYWIVQFGAAVCGSLLARAFFGKYGHLAATMPQHGMSWQAAGFGAILTFGLVLMILNLANGPKLNGPFVPLAVGAYIMAWGTMGGPYDGASMNPARSFGPDLAIGNLSTEQPDQRTPRPHHRRHREDGSDTAVFRGTPHQRGIALFPHSPTACDDAITPAGDAIRGS
ncbi:MAG TPA: aquaporin [Solirubrobacteraceae bacterium]|nr:aquaporin [Solirubrobacteraceae bacterium]